MNIPGIIDPIERFIAFVTEREAIRIRREEGMPWPWTDDITLQTYRFTNIHREDDKVSRHYQKTIREHYGEFDLVLPATVLYRWFNRISTCDAFFNEPMLNNQSVFEEYMERLDIEILFGALTKLPTPHMTGAFIITGRPGYQKGPGVLMYFQYWMQKPWRETWHKWLEEPPLLSEMYDWLTSDGLGSFMKGQLIADLKYLPFMRDVPDWWTWAAPGPGSMKGLNIVFGRSMNTTWQKGQWLEDLQRLSEWVTPVLGNRGINKLHNQDLQNCLCEFSKFTKVTTGVGRPRQVYRREAC